MASRSRRAGGRRRRPAAPTGRETIPPASLGPGRQCRITALMQFMRRLLPVLAGVCLAAAPAAAWAGEPAAAPLAAPSVRLLSPAAGQVLEGGTDVTLAWEPAGPLDPRIEEWEAFLSVDGGATYPIRITPHLDLDLRRVSFPVPRLPSAYVRILLRLGDERREVPVAVPSRLAIAARPGPLLPSAAVALGAGERPRRDDLGVVAWVAGSRRGEHLETVVAAPPVRGMGGVRTPPEARAASPADGGSEPPRPAPPAPRTGLGSRPASPARPVPAAPHAAPARSILLQTSRLNE